MGVSDSTIFGDGSNLDIGGGIRVYDGLVGLGVRVLHFLGFAICIDHLVVFLDGHMLSFGSIVLVDFVNFVADWLSVLLHDDCDFLLVVHKGLSGILQALTVA